MPTTTLSWTASQTPHSTYSCYCIDGYTGVQCQTNWDECWSSPCQNGGTCIDGVAQYNCSCQEGFAGKNIYIFYFPLSAIPSLLKINLFFILFYFCFIKINVTFRHICDAVDNPKIYILGYELTVDKQKIQIVIVTQYIIHFHL